jgi:predicted DNA-binding transcriptional regulator AlpA
MMNGFESFINEDASLEHEILGLYNDRDRYRITDISNLTGISPAGIYRILEKYGINPHRHSHLLDAHNIIKQYAQLGTPVSKIAELTGYSKRQIYNII